MTRSEIVGANIYKCRTAINMSQVDFADAIGRSQTMVSMYENGQRLPYTKIMSIIAKVLGVPFGTLYFSEEERHENSGEPYVDDDVRGNSYTKEERHLIEVYREALPEIRKAAMQMLELNPMHKKIIHPEHYL